MAALSNVWTWGEEVDIGYSGTKTNSNSWYSTTSSTIIPTTRIRTNYIKYSNAITWDDAQTHATTTAPEGVTAYVDLVENEWTTAGTAARARVRWYSNVTNVSTSIKWAEYSPPVVPISERLKKIIEERCAPRIITGVKPMSMQVDLREIRARETLQRVIGEEKYRTFLKKGFVSVRQPKSGLIFQIFPGHGITKVFDKGQLVERLCVVLSGDFPPTDSLIMRYLMILNNEEQFRSYAVKHGIHGYDNKLRTVAQVPQRSLVDIFKSLKKAA